MPGAAHWHWARRRQIRTRLFCECLGTGETCAARVKRPKSGQAIGGRKFRAGRPMMHACLRPFCGGPGSRCLLTCPPQSRSEVSQAVLLGGLVNLTRERGVYVYRCCAFRPLVPGDVAFTESALIHGIPRQSLPLNARRGGWRTSGEGASGKDGWKGANGSQGDRIYGWQHWLIGPKG